MIEEIKQSEVWRKLNTNPKFEEEFEKCTRNCLFSVRFIDLIIEIKDNKLIVHYDSNVKNRDLDCQYKMFDKTEFYLDEENNLVINKLDGKLESNYGYDFATTNGGVLNTYYCCQVYDNDGIEMDYQSYSDKHHLSREEFEDYNLDLSMAIEGAYNPHLSSYANVTGVYPRSNIIGRDVRFLKQIRSEDNLGIVEVTKCSLTPDARLKDIKEEFYFNTFLTAASKHNPELIHIVNGSPFAVVENNIVKIDDEYTKLGLTSENYRDVARDRFLKELSESRLGFAHNSEVLPKYDLMIDKIENRINVAKNIH